jgi:thiol:disulfide interchange protein
VLAVTAVLSGLVLIAFAAWLYEGLRHNANRWRRWGLAASALPLIGAVAIVRAAGTKQILHAAATENNVGITWLPFSSNKIDELEAQGRSIFVDFTAGWCITCKINERVALESHAVIEAFARNDIAALRADWTRQDPSITRMLEANGRVGVPLYLFYPKPGPRGERHRPIILPQILTAATILRETQSQ